MVTASIHLSILPLSTGMGVLYSEPPLKFPHQLMITSDFHYLIATEDGLSTTVYANKG